MRDVPRVPPTPDDVPRVNPAQRGVVAARRAEWGKVAERLDPAASFAAEQSGIVTRAQLVAAGLSTSAIDRRIAVGTLVRVHRGVYAVGHRALRPEGFWLAAVLAAGPGAVLSHRSAAIAWELRAPRRGRIDVTTRRRGAWTQPGLQAHECRLRTDDVTMRRGVPITTPSRTLLDLAEVVPDRQLRRALERSIELGLFSAAAMGQVLETAHGRRGLKRLRAALATLQLDPGVPHSELEHRALELVRASGLPRPAVNARVGRFEVDLLWPRQRLIVELDGYAYHRSPEAFDRDRRRDADLEAGGYRVLRLTWHHITEDPGWVIARISALLNTAR